MNIIANTLPKERGQQLFGGLPHILLRVANQIFIHELLDFRLGGYGPASD
jgi:hypothetical protein